MTDGETLALAGRFRWQGTAHNHALAAVGVTTGISLLVYGAVVDTMLIAPFVAGVVILASVYFMSVRVVVTERSVVVAGGPWKWRIRRVDISRIRRARWIQDLRASIFGGWGYRICGRRCSAIFIRSGEVLVLDLEGDRQLMITVDGAEAGAGTINSLLQHAGRTHDE